MADPIDSEISLVRIYHPGEGEAPPDWFDEKGRPIKCKRGAYLRGKYGIRVRTQYPKGMSLHAGWMSPMLDDEKKKYMQVHWFPRYWGKLFKQLWGIYLFQLVAIERTHPFAFVSFQPNTLGRPYAIDSYRENHGGGCQTNWSDSCKDGRHHTARSPACRGTTLKRCRSRSSN